MELTVPYDDRIEVSRELKKSEYQEIVNVGESKDWKVKLWSVEVRCRGFAAVSLGNHLRDIVFSAKHLKLIGETAQSTSISTLGIGVEK